jgi:hypothetical protein
MKIAPSAVADNFGAASEARIPSTSSGQALRPRGVVLRMTMAMGWGGMGIPLLAKAARSGAPHSASTTPFCIHL